ncbi:ADP-ribose diphosphatase [Shewanella sp. Choline-02u-19]|jgi:ADP-ribose pyrophosphatase|uniref:ADP-ribose diphosphatase n=1 Tax=unclassified Shewanella TaxID=196818 RepID=UPI000C338377|nr:MULTISPECIES: ADP-ribose diphosphatase [unclassified Shewanella]PKG55647.1 ADP-ribose diphosphatase [Shewanella sp. GutDb-MelDb]PKG74561.1 ADP-ribose diphosphatase [Shewanella sp. GutCb]PKH55457.1 ADP-ribose diphosphatase [Shewanella sp. Bg11-22]PKI28804.1 ADP-ribose diphosphatase [Shewanella sp. Choline-02u-19]
MNNTFSHKDVELLAKKTLYKGFFKMEEYRFKHRLFDGGWSGEVTREVFERGHAVVVLPYDPIKDKVVLIEQIRIPVLGSAKSPWLFELVAGMIDPGQTSENVAIKELKEETGLDALSVTKLNQYFSSPGGTSERFDFYWAAVDSSNAGGNYGLPEEHEDIKVHVVDRELAYKMLTDGLIDNASTVIGLQWLQLNYRDLIKRNSEK